MAPAVVAGRVVDPDGQPIAGASVMFSASPVAVPDIAELTGSDGSFAMAAPAIGSYRVAVYATGHAAAEREVEVSAVAAAALEIVLERETC
jgi:hypothetical protein